MSSACVSCVLWNAFHTLHERDLLRPVRISRWKGLGGRTEREDVDKGGQNKGGQRWAQGVGGQRRGPRTRSTLSQSSSVSVVGTPSSQQW
jgi:hypothetical protein